MLGAFMVEMVEAILIVENVLKMNNLQFPKKLVEDLASVYIRRDLTDGELNNLVLKVQESLEREAAEEGEAVGIIAGQSIGEAFTQMLYDNKHRGYSVNGKKSLIRAIEILDARRLISNPTMTIYFEDEFKNDEEFVRNIASRIGKSSLNDVLSDFSLDYANNWVVACLDEEKIANRRLDYYDIINHIGRRFRKVGIEGDKLFFESRNGSIRELRDLADIIRDLQISGIRGIGKAFVYKAGLGSVDSEWVIQTEGSNLRAILKIEGIDKVRSTTNDIHEIELVLGIEAARNAIINELHTVFLDQGLNVDIRHIMIVADAMTSEGIVKSIGRYGISGDKSSVLARAAFEMSGEQLLNASIRGEVDDLTGVIENIIVGQAIPMSKGSSSVKQKHKD